MSRKYYFMSLFLLLIYVAIIFVLDLTKEDDKVDLSKVEDQVSEVQKLVDNIQSKDPNSKNSNYFLNSNNNMGLGPSYDNSNVKELTEKEIEKYKNDIKNVKFSGRLVIPSIDLNLPILEGINPTHLMVGAAEQKPRGDQKLGDIGNYILVSHKMSYTQNICFSKLHTVKIGDIIYATDGDNVYKYLITTVDLDVSNNDTSYINSNPEDEAIMTLYTCKDFGKDSKKIVVQATLKCITSLNGIDDEVREILFKKNNN